MQIGDGRPIIAGTHAARSMKWVELAGLEEGRIPATAEIADRHRDAEVLGEAV